MKKQGYWICENCGRSILKGTQCNCKNYDFLHNLQIKIINETQRRLEDERFEERIIPSIY